MPNHIRGIIVINNVVNGIDWIDGGNGVNGINGGNGIMVKRDNGDNGRDNACVVSTSCVFPPSSCDSPSSSCGIPSSSNSPSCNNASILWRESNCSEERKEKAKTSVQENFSTLGSPRIAPAANIVSKLPLLYGNTLVAANYMYISKK